MPRWYSRPVLFVADIDRAASFYVGKLGFREAWRFAEEGKSVAAQVSRGECELILSAAWPEKIGAGMIFISLDGPGDVDALRAECATRGVAVREDWWGYRCAIIDDPDGNQLYFPYPNDKT